jgi:hypothetical protein
MRETRAIAAPITAHARANSSSRDSYSFRYFGSVCTLATVDGVQRKGPRPGYGRFRHADVLAAALGLDMTGWFPPTAENFSWLDHPPRNPCRDRGSQAPPVAPAWCRPRR